MLFRVQPERGPIKRSITIAGHRTSLTLEDAFWRELKAIAADRGLPLSALIAQIDGDRVDRATSLTSAVRVFVLEAVKAARAI